MYINIVTYCLKQHINFSTAAKRFKSMLNMFF